MTAEQLRGARIGLLKVTHLPYVALILVFENARGRLVPDRTGRPSRRNEWQSVLQKNKVGNVGNGSGLPRPGTNPLASKLTFVRQPSFPDKANDIGAPARNGSQPTSEVKEAIDKLSAQVESLTQQLRETGNRR